MPLFHHLLQKQLPDALPPKTGLRNLVLPFYEYTLYMQENFLDKT